MAGNAERAEIAWRRLLSLGCGMNKPAMASASLICSAPSAPAVGRILIRWNLVLETAVAAIGGTEPAYAREKVDGLIQARVSFRIPLDRTRNVFQTVEVTGMKCLEVWEAESMAATHVLAELEHEPFHIKILDVSRLRCEEMERDCNRYLLKAGEVCRGNKLPVSDWQDTIQRAEACCRGLYEEVVDNIQRGSDSVYGQIAFDAAGCIYELKKTSYLELSGLTGELEQIRAAEWDVTARAEHRFRSRCDSRPRTQPGDLPSGIKLCMKVILDEIISSLGMDEPAFKFTPTEAGSYVCEVLLC